MTWRIAIACIVAIIGSILFVVFEAGSTMLAPKEDMVVATVNEKKIYESELKDSLHSAKMFGKDEVKHIMNDPSLKKHALDKLINNILLVQAAELENYKVTTEEVSMHIDELKSNFSSDQDFNKVLKKYNLTKKQLEETIREELLVSSLLEDKIRDIHVSDEEIETLKKEYKSHSKSNVTVKDEELEQKIKQHIFNQKKNEQTELFIETLREEHKIRVFI